MPSSTEAFIVDGGDCISSLRAKVSSGIAIDNLEMITSIAMTRNNHAVVGHSTARFILTRFSRVQ